MKKIILGIGMVTSLGLVAQNNVGIGTLTPNPQSILDIQSDDKGILISRLTTLSRTTLGTSLTAAEDGMLVYDKDLTTFFYWDGPNLLWVQVGSGVATDDQNITGSSFNVTTGDLEIAIEDGASQTLNIKDNDWYKAGGTDRPITITENIYTQGNVGVGLITPTHKLHVLGGDVFVEMVSGLGVGSLGGGGLELYRDPTGTVPTVNGFIDFKDNAGDDSDFRIFYNNTIGTNGALIFSGSTTGSPTGTPQMVIRNQDGFVGIGTTNPIRKLQVEQGSLLMNGNVAQIYLQADPASTDPGDIVFVNGDGTNKARVWSDPANNEGLLLNGSGDAIVHMKIIQNGNVGVNIGVPTSKLDINGDLRVRTITLGSSVDEVLVVDGTGVVKKVAALVPPGMVNAFAGATAPAGYLICDGSAIDRTTYTNLFAVVGTTYGAGNGTTTFNLPDLRGEFIRGLDAGRGIDIGRGMGANQNASQVSYISNTSSDCPGCGTLGAAWSDAVWGTTGSTWENVTSTELGGPQGRLATGTSHQVTKISGSTRPRNVAMNYCIKF